MRATSCRSRTRSAITHSALDELEPRGVRIGFLADMGVGLPVHPEVRAVAEAAARALAGAGCAVQPSARS